MNRNNSHGFFSVEAASLPTFEVRHIRGTNASTNEHTTSRITVMILNCFIAKNSNQEMIEW